MYAPPTRAASLAEPQRLRPLIPRIRARMNELLGEAVEAVRARFGGKLSYASVPLDGVDWRPFDTISTDAGYRTAQMAARFREDIRAFVAQGRAQSKPAAITEFGCAAFRGAADLAGQGISDIIEWDDRARPVRLKGEYTRDEDEQAPYISECWTFLIRGALTPPSCTRSPVTTWRTPVQHTKVSTWQAPAWLKCSTRGAWSALPRHAVGA
jgi:hypothetical protein